MDPEGTGRREALVLELPQNGLGAGPLQAEPRLCRAGGPSRGSGHALPSPCRCQGRHSQAAEMHDPRTGEEVAARGSLEERRGTQP